MAFAKDLTGVGVTPEQALRDGDTGTILIQSVATIGGPTGATVIQIGSASTLTFLNTTPMDTRYLLINTGTTATILVPTSAGSNTSVFQDGATSFSMTSGFSALAFRMGVIGTVSTTTDRWCYITAL